VTDPDRYVWIEDSDGLDALIRTLLQEPRYALDTEFHRERTYFPKAALVQIAWPGGIALIDPLAVELGPLSSLMHGPGLAVLHAAQQDLEVLDRLCGAVPARLFDTQIAASFLGWSSPSLVNLLAAELGVHVGKADRLTDWLARPLSEDQKAYAASDVEHLLALHDRLAAALARRGRSEWVADECERLRCRPSGGTPPDEAWTKLKDVRSLKPRARGVARAVAAWRERRAMVLDQPVRFVLADLAIAAIAQRAPRTLEELRSVRGIEDRHARGEIGRSVLAAVEEGLAHPVEAPASPSESDLDRHLRPAVTLVSAWVAQMARDADLDTTVLATRSDIVELLAEVPGARLAEGWRGALVGEGIRELVGGRAALAFAGRGALRLLPVADGVVVPGAGRPSAVSADG
jgi:ribonuclease D